MIPIALILGILGQIFIGKKILTTFFCSIIALIINQIKNPLNLKDNILETIKIAILVLLGECAGWALKRFFRLSKKKKNIPRKIKIEKLKCGIFFTVFFCFGIILSSVFNGNYFAYIEARNNLKRYFIANYNSSSRFKIISSTYDNFIYTFYTQDMLDKDITGKFNIYAKENYEVHDGYEEQIKEKEISLLNNEIESLNIDEKIAVYAQNTNFNEITLNFSKFADNITKSEIEEYAKQINDIVEKIQTFSDYYKIDQLKIVLESRNNPKENLASYIYLSSYEQVQKSNGNIVEYISKALNIEYFE